MTPADAALRSSVRAEHSRLRKWLLESAYPIWSTRGVDHERGGFHERLTLDGQPTGDPRRARVQPRQIFAFSRAEGLGWKGDARAVMAQGLEYFLARFRRPDGLFRTLVAVDGQPLDERAFLYDQDFALLSFASAPAELQAAFDLAAEAERLRAALYTHLKRTGIGFEAAERSGSPLFANPHMHLLESALAWLAVDGDAIWRTLADELGNLALTHLIDPATGMLHESFDDSWRPTHDMAGRLVEPGHQYEWAWLLLRWQGERPDVKAAAVRLMDVAETHGVHDGVAVNVLLNDSTVHDAAARLWPQTERLRVSALAARLWGDARYWAAAKEAATALLRYFETPVAGLWYDRLSPARQFVPDTVTAGNLYHIVGAIAELDELVRSAS